MDNLLSEACDGQSDPKNPVSIRCGCNGLDGAEIGKLGNSGADAVGTAAGAENRSISESVVEGAFELVIDGVGIGMDGEPTPSKSASIENKSGGGAVGAFFC